LSDFSTAIEIGHVVCEHQIVLVYQIFDVEVCYSQNWDDWYDTAEKEAVEENHQTVTVVIAKVKLVIILEWWYKQQMVV